MAEAVGEQLKELAESVGEVVGALNERMAGLEQAKVPDVAVRTLEGVGRSVCSGGVGWLLCEKLLARAEVSIEIPLYT